MADRTIATSEFSNFLNHVEVVLNYFDSSLQRLSSLSESIDTQDSSQVGQVAHESSVLQESEPHLFTPMPQYSEVRASMALVYGALYVSIVAKFEYFVKEVVRAQAEELARMNPWHEQPSNFKKIVLSNTLSAAKEPRKYPLSTTHHLALLARLAPHFLDGSTKTRVEFAEDFESELVVFTDSNLRSEVVTQLFSNVEISDIWSKMAKQAKIMTIFAQPDERSCRSACTAFLDEVMNKRNSLAHPTDSTEYPSKEELVSLAANLRTYSQVLVEICAIPR